MYKRFLNDSDYKGIITEKHFVEFTRNDFESVLIAEESAESSLIDYLSENYEIEEALCVGKSILEYNRQITYPSGSFFYKDGKLFETIRTINGRKAPTDSDYWIEHEGALPEVLFDYSQLNNYSPGDIVRFANRYYVCLNYNGLNFDNVRVPGLVGWRFIETYPWVANLDYNAWDVVSWGGNFYALLDKEEIDLTINPFLSDSWGMIGDYDPNYNEYAFSDIEYIVFNGAVYAPMLEVNSDDVKEGFNVKVGDPRNSNIKKHMARMALFELFKLITPNNVSQVRITDYEASIQWLRDASKLRINPQIKRKLDDEMKPVTDWQVATFQRDYDPYKNAWQI